MNDKITMALIITVNSVKVGQSLSVRDSVGSQSFQILALSDRVYLTVACVISAKFITYYLQ